MKLSSLLTMVSVISALSFGSAAASAKTKSHSKTHSSKSHSSTKSSTDKAAPPAPSAADAEEASAPADKSESESESAEESNATSGDSNSGDSKSSVTTTTTTDSTTTTPADDTTTVTPPAGSTDTTGATTTTAAPADTTVVPMAQPAPEMVAPPPPTPVAVAPGRSVVFLPVVSSSERAAHGYAPVLGIAVSAGGGALDFVGGSIKDATKLGGFWTVRALVGSRSIVGLEAAYIGSAQSITALGLANDARLLSNGVEGTLRINAPVAIKSMLIEPFAFGGGGWSHYNIVNTKTSSASVKDSDDVITLPVGGGIALGYGGLIVDARFTYRFSYDNDLIQGAGVDRGLDNWNAGGTVGFEF